MNSGDLKAIGLTEKEAKVYLACLESGQAGAAILAKKANMPKTTTYDALNSLLKRGLVTTYFKKSQRQFVASDPYHLDDRLEQQRAHFATLLPELIALYSKQHHKPRLRFFEGKEGVRIMLSEALQEATDMISVNSLDDIYKKLSDYFPRFSQERAKKRIPLRIICRDSKTARQRQESGPRELRQVKIKETAIPFHSALISWKNKLVLITLRDDLMIVIIESEDITQLFRAMFEWLWNQP